MRLLHAKQLRLVDFPDDALVPNYAILSHTWGSEEVLYQDIQLLNNRSVALYFKSRVRAKKGFSKVKSAAALAAQHGYDYIWIDTCCIDKSSSAELSEAINSMYRWYEQSDVCYAYLLDVEPAIGASRTEVEETIHRSRWFQRGWTLQELIAPGEVLFYAGDWKYLGAKKRGQPWVTDDADSNYVGSHLLTKITKIDERVLCGALHPQVLSVATRMSWAALRVTTRAEDIAYCLLGLFAVNIPLLYGEGSRAFIRLQEAILRESEDQSIFAWSDRESGQQYELCGLLSPSPIHFGQSSNFRPLPPLLTGDSMPPSISSQGLHVKLFLRKIVSSEPNRADDDYEAALDCLSRDGKVDKHPTITLRRLWGNHFARINVSRLDFTQSSVLDASSSDGYLAIYVHQNPRWVLPEFVVDPTGTDVDEHEDGFIAVDAYPRGRWDSLTKSLTSDHSQINSIMGVLGFRDGTSERTSVAVCVGLRREQDGIRCWGFQLHWPYPRGRQS
jgi:hypothetical protein